MVTSIPRTYLVGCQTAAMASVQLTDRDAALLRGEGTEAQQLAMRIVVAAARVLGAEALLDVTQAHIDSCLYHGRSGLDFAERLLAGDAKVAVPSTLNVSSLDLLHPDLYRGDPETAVRARRLMECYELMGCRATWTCAPYQLTTRPRFGEHIAWAESNAIVFANSVLGARTHRYGDFIDICAAITGRVADAGLHRTENRRGQIVFDVGALPDPMLARSDFPHLLGLVVGRRSGSRVPVIEGLPASISEDDLKAIGAAAASSGAVGMFHAVGITPEARTLDVALGGAAPQAAIVVTAAELAAARSELTTSVAGPLAAVSVGTPHASVAELAALVRLLDGRSVSALLDMYVSTGRDMLEAATTQGLIAPLLDAGVQVVVDTCTYITPVMKSRPGAVMTNAAKWAYYAPANLGVDVLFGSLEECVESAVAGEVRRDDRAWSDA
jgi:predicted aconitase